MSVPRQTDSVVNFYTLNLLFWEQEGSFAAVARVKESPMREGSQRLWDVSFTHLSPEKANL